MCIIDAVQYNTTIQIYGLMQQDKGVSLRLDEIGCILCYIHDYTTMMMGSWLPK